MTVSEAVERYVAIRRSDGLPFVSSAATLRTFCKLYGRLEVADLSPEHVNHFLADARIAPVTRVGKFSAVKCFLEHAALDGSTASLSLDRPPRPKSFRHPFIYTRDQIRELLAATDRCQARSTEMSAESFRLVLLLLYATGCTVTELVAARTPDFDRRKRTLTLGGRLLPIQPTLVDAIATYLRTHTRKTCKALLASPAGAPIRRKLLNERFARLLQLAPIEPAAGMGRPRLQDFRYTFAVHRLNTAVERGEQLDRIVPALSTYMGYRSLLKAEDYLAYVPGRFAEDVAKLSPSPELCAHQSRR